MFGYNFGSPCKLEKAGVHWFLGKMQVTDMYSTGY